MAVLGQMVVRIVGDNAQLDASINKSEQKFKYWCFLILAIYYKDFGASLHLATSTAI